MPTTTPTYALPYPESSDPPNGPGQIGALAQAVETELERVDADLDTRVLANDEGWNNLATTADWSSQPRYRRRGGIVYLEAGITKNGTVTDATVQIGTLPSGYRPEVAQYEVAFMFLNGTSNVRFYPLRVFETGVIEVYATPETGSLANTGLVRFTLSFPADDSA